MALLTGVFTLLSMSKIWNEAFLKPHPGGAGGGSGGGGSLRSADGLQPALWAVGTLAAGIAFQPALLGIKLGAAAVAAATVRRLIDERPKAGLLAGCLTLAAAQLVRSGELARSVGIGLPGLEDGL